MIDAPKRIQTQPERACEVCGKLFRPHSSQVKRGHGRCCSKQCGYEVLCHRMTEDIIRANSIPEPNSGCWIWTGALHNTGYGTIRISRKTWSSHRLSYFLSRGEVPPKGMFVCHHCDMKACVNPEHIYLGTHRDNTRDAVVREKMWHGRAINTAVLFEKDIAPIRGLLASGLTCAAIGERYGVHADTIGYIKRGKSWKHVR